MSSTAHCTTGAASSRPLPNPTVCVVDPRGEDYNCWKTLAPPAGVRLELVATADEALRLARTHRIDLWMINAELPGLSGLALCGMLKAQDDRTTVYLVADEYTPELEQAAWQARATLFGCKGAHDAWLGEWLRNRSLQRLGPAAAKRTRRALASP